MKAGGWNDTLRFVIPVCLLGLGALGLAVRLVFLHLNLVSTNIQTPKYEFNRIMQSTRGSIYSAQGNALAKTTTVWTYCLDPVTASTDNRGRPIKPEKRMENIRTISEILSLPMEKVMDAYARQKTMNVFLTRSDDDGAHSVLSDPKRRIRGLKIDETQVRIYPQGNRLSHVLGFVSKDPTNSVGCAGIEMFEERYLKDTHGAVHGEKDAIGREERSRRRVYATAKPGSDVYLTVDMNVQMETEKALREGLAKHRAESAWAIVLSVKTGAVLAMVSLPDYDPENYNKAPQENWRNRAISENYEPGSVMKTITACAVLDTGLHGPDSLISTDRGDPNYYRLPGDAGHKWEPFMSVREALVHSSNIVFGKLGYDLTPVVLEGYMKKFGLGVKTGIHLPGEETGIIPNPRKWDKVKWSRAPIGQGVAVTAIQLAGAYATIGNDGEKVQPYIVEKIVDVKGDVLMSHAKGPSLQVIAPSTARKVRDMMTGVVKKGGTARAAAVPGYTVAGKTGTAQLDLGKGRGYSSTDYNASFIGIVPATQPEIVILVTYHRPFFCRSRATAEAEGVPIFNHQGGVCAAPTFRRIAEIVLRYLEVEPDIPDEIPEDDFEDLAAKETL